jgi:hypothetical protein
MQTIGRRAARWAIGAMIMAVIGMPGGAGAQELTELSVALYEANVDLARYLKRYRIPLDIKGLAERIASPDVKGLFASAIVPGAKDAIPEKVYRDALAARPALQRLYAETFRTHGIAALVFPTTPLPAAPIGDDQTTKLNGADVPTFPTFIQNTDPGSNAGIPGHTVPIGRTAAGLPVGRAGRARGQRPAPARHRARAGSAVRPPARAVRSRP